MGLPGVRDEVHGCKGQLALKRGLGVRTESPKDEGVLQGHVVKLVLYKHMWSSFK